MRFISPNPGYKFCAVKEDFDLLASGQYRQNSPPFICEFKMDATLWEQEFAREHFKFRGVPHDESGVRDIDPVLSRVSSYDTSVIENPELREKVEARLIATQRADDHLLVEKPAIPAPWPTYDKVHPSKIAAKVTEDGFDPQEVIEYEKINKNRISVIEALDALIVEQPAEELISA